MEKASNFKGGKVECGDHTNNLAGIMFSQLVAHDISNRMVVTMRGFIFFLFTFLFLPKIIQMN